MEAFLVSVGVVALGEIGDKTQLLALLLATRYRKALPIVAGVLVATLANHALAGLFGAWLRSVISPEMMRWGLGLSFLAVAAWVLVPDKIDDEGLKESGQWGVFALTTWLFFLAEIGDKTQIATIMLAARYDALVAVVTGTTLGMMLVNVPTVLVGRAMAPRIPLKWVRAIAALLFAGLGIAVLAGAGEV